MCIYTYKIYDAGYTRYVCYMCMSVLISGVCTVCIVYAHLHELYLQDIRCPQYAICVLYMYVRIILVSATYFFFTYVVESAHTWAIRICQKRPGCMAKETYLCCKRDLIMYRHTCEPQRRCTSLSGPHKCQKRPNSIRKETYIRAKETYYHWYTWEQQWRCTSQWGVYRPWFAAHSQKSVP